MNVSSQWNDKGGSCKSEGCFGGKQIIEEIKLVTLRFLEKDGGHLPFMLLKIQFFFCLYTFSFPPISPHYS